MKTELEMAWEKLVEEASKFIDSELKEVEHILRNYVSPTIKGDITASKLRWRGIKYLYYNRKYTDGGWELEGIIQRGIVINKNGDKFKPSYGDDNLIVKFQ